MQVDVGPIETGNEHLRALEPEQSRDVVAHLAGGRRRERRDRRSPAGSRRAPALGGGRPQPAIVGAEVVAPLRHAVRFVHDEPRDRQRRQQLQKPLRREALRRHVEQPQRRRAARPEHITARAGRQHRVERPRRDAAPVQTRRPDLSSAR